MRCEHRFCIYCNEYICILDYISIDSVGLCSECILINIDDDIIDKEKKRILDKY